MKEKSHRLFCSTYVQLSRVQSLQGVSLLKPIQLSDINSTPHLTFFEKDKKLEILEEKILKIFNKEYEKQ